MSCVGCKCDGKPKTEEPCCRCDTERERKARLMDDPVLAKIHETIMQMAEAWRKGEYHPDMEPGDKGRVIGAALVFHHLAMAHDWKLADAALWEYHALVGLGI